ncbi:MAG: tRNA 2-thiouridine(34) synthase MnmA [Bacteroidales bacterium]|nr:tRNA 2-thiouridine(34) synthase MnmA [Bacteroidales bacterium]
MKKRVVIGLSGGVDSSVAAYILKEQGYDVVGLFMKNWHDTTGLVKGDCPFDEDVMFAEMVARRIGIPFHQVDLSGPYRKRVVDYMFSEYEKGRTPNPDVLCNREIKFDSFAEEAFKLGADLIATGHYCRKETVEKDGKTIFRLLAGKDKNKDQSYFLCQVTQQQLSKALFPIGDITKPEVRKIASSLNLVTATRKDSQGICFVGKVDLPTFLQQQLAAKTGRVVEISRDFEFPLYGAGMPGKDITGSELVAMSTPYDYNPSSGKTIGKHQGAHFFTVGQRKGLNIGGHKEPLFIIGTDTEHNIVYTGEGKDHPGLYRKALFIRREEVHWIRPDLAPGTCETMDADVRIRYRQPLEKGRLFMREEGLYIIFEQNQRGIAPGQFAAWYTGDELTGSGVIDS